MQLLTLYQCQENLRARLAAMNSGGKIHIRHLGLDLSNVSDQMITLLANLRAKDICLQLLVITGPKEDSELSVASEIRQWRVNVAHNVEKVIQRLRLKLEGEHHDAKTLRIYVRQYSEIPVVHGFSLEQADDPIVTYLSFNRWTKDGKEIDWGENGYREIPGNAEDPSSLDLREVFATWFEHLWRAGPSTEREFLIGAPADGYEYDVFLSYNSKERSDVHALAELLRRLNFKVWVDDSDIPAGGSLYRHIDEGLSKSRVAIALLGIEGLGPHQTHELEVFWHQRAHKPDPGLIPVVLPSFQGKPEFPGFISHLKYLCLGSNITPDSVKPLVEAIRSAKAGRD